jgi:hypothetical protein
MQQAGVQVKDADGENLTKVVVGDTVKQALARLRRWGILENKDSVSLLDEDLITAEGAPYVFTPHQQHAMSLELYATKQELHATQQDSHATKQELHATQQDSHATKQELHATQQDSHATKQELHATKQELHAMSLDSLRSNYPVLKDRTASGPYIPRNHDKATIDESMEAYWTSIDALGFVPDNFWRAGLWATPQAHEISCDSETDAVSHVVAILKSILIGLQLNDVVETVANRTLAGCECDILLVYKPNRLPFSATEVKKPANCLDKRRMIFNGTRDDGNLIAGELYDECKAVELFGFNKVIGMVTTGNHWRLTCTKTETEDEFGKGLNTVVKRLRAHVAGHKDELEEDATSPSQSEVVYTKEEPRSDTSDRILYTSQVVPTLTTDDNDIDDGVARSGEDVVKLVTLYVLKACLSLVDMLDLNRPKSSIVVRKKMPCRLLNQNAATFAFSTVNLTNLNLDKFIRTGVNVIHVIHHIASGEFGSCCLGVTSNGAACCAIKFFHGLKGTTPAVQAEAELKNWNLVYKHERSFKCLTWKAAGSKCLVMPYMRPVNAHNRHDLLDKDTISKALKEFSSTGYTHRDIKWRHFGWWEDKLFLCDLGEIARSNKAEVKKWLGASIVSLRKSAGIKQQPRTPSVDGKKGSKSGKGGSGSLKRTRSQQRASS